MAKRMMGPCHPKAAPLNKKYHFTAENGMESIRGTGGVARVLTAGEER